VQVEEGHGLVVKQSGVKKGITAAGRGEVLSFLGVARGPSSSRGGAAAARS
jgi:hypothetical protein